MKKIFFLILLIILTNLLIINAAESNLTSEQKAIICLETSKQTFLDLKNANFSTQRVGDNLKKLQQIFDAQVVLKEKKSKYDFSQVTQYCEEIKKIKEDAFQSRDDLIALRRFYEELIEGINSSSIDLIIEEAKLEMSNERYEKVGPLIDRAYKEIITLKSKNTTFNLVYETASKTVGKVLYNARYYILSGILLIIFLLIVYKKTISRWIIQKKIKRLELRKTSLKKLLMDTQRDYFSKGSISEGIFNIKTKKLGELVRDIERQIPLLQEQLAKLSWGREVKK
jgi:hypothetical protein